MEEGEKRKQDDNDVVSKSAMKKPKEETELKEVEEEEVEEFFAILRRIQIAVKYFNKVDGASGSGRGGCDERKMTNDIDRKCIDEIIGDNEEIKEKEKNKLGLDLNMKPYDPHEEDT
ncbi:protein NIM1-INTERACTING 2 [Capsicum galapagoense]